MKDVFLIFEGGGAKCIAHIGALRALERRGFKIRGVAGTSAGALIAALVAAGYSSDEMFSVEGDTAGTSPVVRSVGLRGTRDLLRRRDLIALTLLLLPGPRVVTETVSRRPAHGNLIEGEFRRTR